jgi:hypothetical protein
MGIIAVAYCSITACALLYPSKMVISNIGTTTATSLSVISSEGQTWPLGDLPPGETTHFTESLSGEGSLQVEFTVGGKRVRSRGGCYYTSGGMNPADGIVTIRGEEVQVDCRSG